MATHLAYLPLAQRRLRPRRTAVTLPLASRCSSGGASSRPGAVVMAGEAGGKSSIQEYCPSSGLEPHPYPQGFPEVLVPPLAVGW